jgi:hypothetical protein
MPRRHILTEICRIKIFTLLVKLKIKVIFFNLNKNSN